MADAVDEAVETTRNFLGKIFNWTTLKWAVGLTTLTVAFSAMAPVAAAAAPMTAAGTPAATGLIDALGTIPQIVTGTAPDVSPSLTAAWDAAKTTTESFLTKVGGILPESTDPVPLPAV